MKVVVCDAGPIIHLYEAKALFLLKNMGEVLLPNSVYSEVMYITDLANSWPEWLHVVTLSNNDLTEASMWADIGDLHIGESEAFVLARKTKADWLLTDDSTARLFASLMGLDVHGSLGVILWNVAQGNISRNEAEQALNGLQQSSLWLSASILREAQKAIIDMTSALS